MQPIRSFASKLCRRRRWWKERRTTGRKIGHRSFGVFRGKFFGGRDGYGLMDCVVCKSGMVMGETGKMILCGQCYHGELYCAMVRNNDLLSCR
ncbi:unnamed protein product [Arabidopsis lyrata]|nr:unnamed protein product [Arabidopsis lyrata]